MTLADATLAEAQGRMLEAADLYEAVIDQPDAPAISFLNLVVLYWQSTDAGVSGTLGLSPQAVTHAGHRLPEILRRASECFPDSTEVRFWRRYIAWADLGEPLEVSWCEELLKDDPESLVPALFPFIQGQGHEDEVSRLLEIVRNEQTTRAKYIRSVVQGVHKRRRRTPPVGGS